MSGTTPRARARRRLVLTVVFYGLLVVLAVFTAVVKRSQPRDLLVDLGLCALAAAWTLWMFTLHPAWRDRPRVVGVFFTGLIVIMLVLVARDPWFGLFTAAGYLFAFELLPWPRVLPGVAAVAVVSGTAQSAGVDKTTLDGVLIYLAIVLANVVPMCGFAWSNWRNEQQSDEREQALVDVTEANHRLEASLAENASLHERLLAQAREAGVLDERQRMAREIHDTLAQGLTGIITQLQAVEQADDDPEGRHRHVQAAIGLARESLSEARRSVHALRPEPLEAARLGEALAAVADRWSALHAIAVQVTTTGTARPLRPDAEFALLRTAQEALTNVAKHARASRVGVTLSYMDHEVALDVRDDGTGFEPEAGGARGELGSGFGLVAMRQRIEGLSGTLQVESERGVGTAVSACVPVARVLA